MSTSVEKPTARMSQWSIKKYSVFSDFRIMDKDEVIQEDPYLLSINEVNDNQQSESDIMSEFMKNSRRLLNIGLVHTNDWMDSEQKLDQLMNEISLTVTPRKTIDDGEAFV